uniref:Protein ZIP4 homolog n=1 Tax=Sinocyclocheilus grahami TaxID=75366 RepID=A0A672T741_SINGR
MILSQSLETLYSRLTSHGDCAEDINTPKGDIEKDLLRVLSYQAESAVSQEQHQEAVSCIQRCKEMLLRLPKETGYLSLICYNFGGYLIYIVYTTAKVLRLLAKVYLDWDCQKYLEKALHAVSLANKEHMQLSGLYLKIQILNKSHRLSELLDCEVPLEVCLSTVKLLVENNREALAFYFLKRVCQHFESSPELGSALLMHIELLLQRDKELLAKQKIEDAITGHYTGKQLAPQTLSSLHLLLWDRASKNFEVQHQFYNYSEALEWYNYSLSFYRAGELDQNLAKLQRNRSTCFLHLNQFEKAKEAVEKSARIDPSNIFTQFNIYKIAVLENNAEKGNGEDVKSHDHIIVGSSEVFQQYFSPQHEQQETAVKALESLCEHSQDVTQILTALSAYISSKQEHIKYLCYRNIISSSFFVRCLVRLVLTTMENISEENRLVDQWCRWNSALQCEHSPVRMRDFFLLSFQLSQLCTPDRGMLMGQKTCLLMAAAASLEICRSSDHTEQQTELLTQTLEHIQLCKEIWTTIKASGTSSKDKTDTLLLLYEFEARAKLNDPKLESVLESVLELDYIETKLLEMIAVLAMEPPAHFPVLCKKALRITLSLHRKQPQVDLTRCSNCLHSLIQLTLPSGVSEVQPCVLEEVWGYYEEALSTIATADFPELEILWLLTRAWNTGILLYSLTQYPEAERWCGLGMSFLKHLGSLQDSYHSQVTLQEADGPLYSCLSARPKALDLIFMFHILLASSQVRELLFSSPQ